MYSNLILTQGNFTEGKTDKHHEFFLTVVKQYSALLEALRLGQIKRKEDENFSFLIADRPVPGCPEEITNPKILYRNQNRFLEFPEKEKSLINLRLDYFSKFG